VYILLELCPNQSLNELLRRRKRLHELEVMYYSKQIIDSLFYLHKHRVIHRDLKLGNLFINEKLELKLGDFGLATKLDFDGERKRTICGTPNYIAPEVLEGRNGHSYEVDIWSLGVIIYTLIIGKPPFETSDVKKTYDRIRKNSYAFPDHVGISAEAKDLIQWILNNDPDNRPTLQDIVDHKFMSYETPDQLHPSLLACPPSSNMIKKYLPADFQVTIKSMPKRLEASAPAGGRRSSQEDKNAPLTAKENLRGKKLDLDDEGAKTNDNDKIGSKNPAASQSSADVPIHAKKWIDYTSKYGLGYILSNGSVGVFFNDATKIILEKEGKKFDYYERKDKEDVKQSHSLEDYPKDIEKKVTLLAHFKSYLDQNFKQEEIEHHEVLSELIYVKKWIKTRHAKMFRLSNKVVQVYFKDKTEILL
jgi:polo-like kinase 1